MVSYILLVKSLRSVTLTNNSDRKSSFKPSRKKTVDFFLSGYTFKMLKPEQFIIALFHRFQISDQRLTKGIQSLSQTEIVEFLYLYNLIWCKPVIFQTQTNNKKLKQNSYLEIKSLTLACKDVGIRKSEIVKDSIPIIPI